MVSCQLGCGRLLLRRGGRRASWNGTQASGTKSSRISMSLCRRWWNSCRISFSSSPHSHLFPSRLSQRRRSCLTMFLRDGCVATRSWWNSWWRCRRSFPGLCCSGLWSRTWAFQFLVVEGESLVFKVFFPDRVQHRCLVLRNAFLSVMWSRSLVLVCLVKAFKIFSPGQSSSSSFPRSSSCL